MSRDADPEALFMDRLNRVGPLVRRAYLSGNKAPADSERDIHAAIARLQEALAALAEMPPRPPSTAAATAVIDDEAT